MSLTISTRPADPDITVVEISGKLILSKETNIANTVANVLSGGGRKVVFELSELSYIDSWGIGQLVASSTKIGRAGGRTCICGMKGLVLTVFQIARIDSLVPFALTLEEACALLSA